MGSQRRLLVCLVGAWLSACGGGAEPAASAAVAEPAAAAKPAEVAPAPEAPKGPPPASIQDNTYRLALEADPSYGEGKDGQFHVVLKAMGGYHVNPDYPIRVDLKGPVGLKLAKTSLGKPDAAEFGEESARFDVSFTAPKGTHAVEASVDFAVCTKETCVPDQRTLALNLQVM